MCGIAGILSAPGATVPEGLVRRIDRVLEHRGPDDAGLLGWSHEGEVRLTRCAGALDGARAVLIHRRLSILDLSDAGWQPMGTEDGRYFLIFNGEIYNYLELRQELQQLGYRFRSQSDTEVLLYAYAHWGMAALERLVGMFAFAVFDMRERSITLARDFVGIKPLYYCHGPWGFAFASEIKALLEIPQVGREADPQAVYEYLRHGLHSHGHTTLFHDVRQLPAGCVLRVPVDGGDVPRPERYWQLRLEQPLEISFQEAAASLRERFLESIRLHLRSDVPVGAALSGGIDSSAIVMAMRLVEPNLDLHTFSYVATDQSLSEERWVDVVGQAARTIVHKVRVEPSELLQDFDRLIRVQDEPFGGTSIYAQHRVFRLAREQGIKVMLDGQGADELLAGYPFYYPVRLASMLRKREYGSALDLLRRREESSGTGPRLALSALGLLMPQRLQDLGKRVAGRGPVPGWLSAAWFAERGVAWINPTRTGSGEELLREALGSSLLETMLPMLLRYEDRNSMAFSVESRVPFLTPSLARFVLSLPEEYLISRDGTTKSVFREAMRGVVPAAILDRKDKIGFATPEQQWLTTMRPWVDTVLRGDALEQVPALNAELLRTEWREVLAGRKQFEFRMWRWVNLVRWTELYGVRYA